jgi:peroxiredoxin Q/BCP
MAKVGDPVPTVRVRDQLGRERSLSEFRGRRVVLWWFPKAATPG